MTALAAARDGLTGAGLRSGTEGTVMGGGAALVAGASFTVSAGRALAPRSAAESDGVGVVGAFVSGASLAISAGRGLVGVDSRSRREMTGAAIGALNAGASSVTPVPGEFCGVATGTFSGDAAGETGFSTIVRA